ncbi:MAG: DUF481 domain-containing protein [Nitrospiraceae bacterium]|nr:DUF481 domain-containing protein [Nitrospiraceae bacterium]
MKISDGALFFRTNLAGQVLAPLDEVTSFSSENDVTVLLSDGRELRGRLELGRGGASLLGPDGVTQEFSMNSVSAAVPSPNPPPAEPESEPAPSTLEGSWETGVHWRSGTDDYTDLFARLALRKETEKFAFRSQWFVERADEDEFPRWVWGEAEWDLSSGRALTPLLGLAIERDTDRGLDLRVNFSAGVARQLLDDENRTLRADIGLDAETASFSADPLWKSDEPRLRGILRRTFNDIHEDRQQLNLRLGLRYSRDLFGNGRLAENLTVYPSLTDWGRLRVRSESTLAFPLARRLQLKLNLLLDYEEDDFQFRDVDRWRSSIGASVLWDF